ncbi:MAG TPA: sterol desaturase family protein [Terriglobales bacterium]|jgi:hypothetical protein
MGDEQRLASIAQGRRIKTLNAAAAVISGTLPAVVLALAYPGTSSRWLIGLLAGVVWANGFEFAYHKYLLHAPRTFFARKHLQHHATVGMPNQAEHLLLGGSPVWIVLLFVVNGLPVIALDLLLHLRIAPGMFVGFVAYVLVVEEIHWRIHLGGWLPDILKAARQHHLLHHDRPDGRFNIFFPLFDWMFGAMGAEKAPALSTVRR